MATYAEIAPIIQGTGVTKTAVETYFENLPEPPEPVPLPNITKTKVTAIADAYLVTGSNKYGGIRKLCNDVGLRKSQVAAILKEIDALKAAWLAAQEEVPEE